MAWFPLWLIGPVVGEMGQQVDACKRVEREPRRSAQVAGREMAGVATLKVTVAGVDEGALRVGLFADTPRAGEVFAASSSCRHTDTGA